METVKSTILRNSNPYLLYRIFPVCFVLAMINIINHLLFTSTTNYWLIEHITSTTIASIVLCTTNQ